MRKSKASKSTSRIVLRATSSSGDWAGATNAIRAGGGRYPRSRGGLRGGELRRRRFLGLGRKLTTPAIPDRPWCHIKQRTRGIAPLALNPQSYTTRLEPRRRRERERERGKEWDHAALESRQDWDCQPDWVRKKSDCEFMLFCGVLVPLGRSRLAPARYLFKS